MSPQELDRLRASAAVAALRQAIVTVEDSGWDIQQALFRLEALLKLRERELATASAPREPSR